MPDGLAVTPWLTGGAAVLIASVAGAALVLGLWPRDQRLSRSTGLGLALLLGPWAVGVALMLGGAFGSPAALTVPVVSLASVAACGEAWRRRRQGTAIPPLRTHPVAHAVLLAAMLWASVLAVRTHLGWDGTVVWYHKARMLAETGGWMPAAALRDTTRTWSAPDYPLHVPLAEAWVLLLMDVEDERVLKLLPAAWCAGILCLVFGAVRDPAGEGHAPAEAEACAAVLLLAMVPRLMVGEGSFTSGYADGPMAGLLAALIWLAWRSDWGRVASWLPMLAVLAAAVVWTKQEGLAAVPIVALAGAARRGRFGGLTVALVPAVAVGIGWQVWVRTQGAPATMAYAWPDGGAAILHRALVVAREYLREAMAVGTWGLFWPALGLAAVAAVRRGAGRPLAIVLGVLAAGGAALVFSAWPDLPEHVRVTAPRQMIQIAPTLVIVALVSSGRLTATICHP